MRNLTLTALIFTATASASELPSDFNTRLNDLEALAKATAHFGRGCVVEIKVYGQDGLQKNDCKKFNNRLQKYYDASQTECKELGAIGQRYVNDNEQKIKNDLGLSFELNRKLRKLTDSCTEDGFHTKRIFESLAEMKQFLGE